MSFRRRRFRPIPGFPGYWINRKGNVYSEKSKKFLTWFNNIKYYPRVDLYISGSRSRMFVHRLVAIVYVKNPDPINKIEVNHNDWNVANPHAKNLQWMTPQENQRYNRKKKWLSREDYSSVPF